MIFRFFNDFQYLQISMKTCCVAQGSKKVIVNTLQIPRFKKKIKKFFEFQNDPYPRNPLIFQRFLKYFQRFFKIF